MKSLFTVAFMCAALSTECADAANSIQVSTVIVDAPTLCCLGFSVPITGDDNLNATAQIEYRVQGASTWQAGLALLRVRPDLLSTEDPPSGYGLPSPGPQFAGSIFGLVADTPYDVRISVSDADGGGSVQTVSVRTRAVPRVTPAVPRAVAVANKTQLTAALTNAQPGDVITLAAGTYAGGVTINASGTLLNPIIVRGATQASVTINATGATYGITVNGDYVYVEDLTVQGSNWGAYAADTRGVAIRRNRFTAVNMGIDARSGSTYDLYICDNRLEGKFLWPNVSSATWDAEGIAVSGQGAVVCFNTLYGFGDAMGLSHLTDIPNIAIDFYGNDVLWSGDDGVELDFSHRNVRFFGNRLVNTGMGASLQPVWGGPVYVFRNVFQNQANSPYKLNNEPSGFYIYNNTSIRTRNPSNANYTGAAFAQIGYDLSDHWSFVANFEMKNNLLVGATGPAKFTSAIRTAAVDFNGWSPDGTFVFFDTYTSLAHVKAASPFESHGLILSGQIFQTAIPLPADYTTQWTAMSVALLGNSNAIDAGVALPNITDNYNGNAPDVGAWEAGSAAPSYGVRSIADTIPPARPTGVQVQ